MSAAPFDPDAERPCSCEETERLRAELASQRDQLVSALQRAEARSQKAEAELAETRTLLELARRSMPKDRPLRKAIDAALASEHG